MATGRVGMDLAELKDRILEIRRLIHAAGATLVPGQGLGQALAEAEAVADGVRAVREGTEQSYIDTGRAMTAVWNFSETLRPCVAAGLDINEHLRILTTGTINYGTPLSATDGHAAHIFKDFEFELFIAAVCLRGGLNVALNPVLNDPSGDLFVESLRLEMKHPNTVNQVEDGLRDFNGALYHNGMYGVFVIGLEDIFRAEPDRVFSTHDEWIAWLESRAQEVEAYGSTFLRMAATRTRILATVQTWTVWYQAAGGISLHRQGNAALLDDRRHVPDVNYADAARIAALYNPDYRRWSQIRFVMPDAISDRQREVLRRALHERAYRIFDDEGGHWGHALQHWLQAKDELGVPRDYMI
jgi:hypothetical protein